jgi:ribosomal protein S18 acetylase RimI-like enzyme
MWSTVRHALTKRAQNIFWVYLTKNSFIASTADFRLVQPKLECRFVPITEDNYASVTNFREASRVSEYLTKLHSNEVGFFAESGGRKIGSVWATVNKTSSPITVRGYMRLMPGEALMHDGVTAEASRGMGVGPFMVSHMAQALLQDHAVRKIVMDVNVRNTPSLNMLRKVGVAMTQKALYVSLFGDLLFQKVLEEYPVSSDAPK